MTSNAHRGHPRARLVCLLLALCLLLPAASCSLRMSTDEQEAEERRQEEEANRPPETEPPETVPLNPPPPINEWEGETSQRETDAPLPSGEDSAGSGSVSWSPEDVLRTEDGRYFCALYEAGGKYWHWDKQKGTFVYDLPARDESGLATVDDMYNISQALWPDQPDDWYGGLWSYDEPTRTSTQVWQRSVEVLDAVRRHHVIYTGDTSRKVVYLTFDAGYENGNTAKVLDVLKEKNAPAAFFINGWFVSSATDLVQRMLDEGHIVGNHCVNHEKLTGVSVNTFLDEVGGLAEQFEAAFPNAPQLTYFRPPAGNCSEWVLTFAEKMGYTTVLWSWTYYDYDDEAQPDLMESLNKLKSGLHPGCVYFFHSTSATTAAMLPWAINWIRSQGYEILPICDIDP